MEAKMPPLRYKDYWTSILKCIRRRMKKKQKLERERPEGLS
jgi:hypothetical protein